MLRLIHADAATLIAILAQQNGLTLQRERYGRFLAQLVISESYAVVSDPGSRAVAVAGIAALPGGAGEVWFGVRPGGLGRDLLPVVAFARAVFASRRAAYSGGLMCLVRDGHRPGERLARCLGFVPQPVMLDDHREWTLDVVHEAQGAGSSRAASGAG